MLKISIKTGVIIIVASLSLAGCISSLIFLDCKREELSKKEPSIKQHNYDLIIAYYDRETIKNIKVVMQCKYNGYGCNAGAGLYEDWQRSYYKDNVVMDDLIVKKINNKILISFNTKDCQELQLLKESNLLDSFSFIEHDIDKGSTRFFDGDEYGLKLKHIFYKEILAK